MAWKKFSKAKDVKKVGIAGDLMNPLNVTEAGLLTVIEGCTAEQLKLGGSLCPLVIGGRVQKLRPDQQMPLRAPHQPRTGYPDRMGPSSPKQVVLVLHQFINSLHKGTEPAPAPPQRDPGVGGGAASHHLAAEPEQVPQRPDLMLPQV